MSRRFSDLFFAAVLALMVGFSLSLVHAQTTDQATLVVVVDGLGEMGKRSDAQVQIYLDGCHSSRRNCRMDDPTFFQPRDHPSD